VILITIEQSDAPVVKKSSTRRNFNFTNIIPIKIDPISQEKFNALLKTNISKALSEIGA